MIAPVLRILYGPPGTGKTWQAARQAVRLIEPATTDVELLDRHQAMVDSGQILWVTFHPSFSYEDFIEGFRPEATEQGVMYVPRPGPFRIACNNVTLSAPPGQLFYVGQKLTSSSGHEYEVTTASADSVMVKNLSKAKGAGLRTPVSLHVIEQLRNAGYTAGSLSIGGDKNAEQKEIAEKVGIDKQSLFGMSGPLRAVWEFVENALPPATERRPVVLIIDEINRADLSRVFGDVITLLEADKRLGSSESKQIMLPYSKVLFGVPPELHIIGTMNTADKSLSVMDLALRRRFEFVEVPPDPSRCANPYAGLDLGPILTGWNRAIAALLSREKQIGHAYLELGKLSEIRSAGKFSDDEDGQLKAVAVAIRHNIMPLLFEIMRGDWRKVDFVFGRDYDNDRDGLLEQRDESALRGRAGDRIDLADLGDYLVPGWWDPHSPTWDAERFRKAVCKIAPPF